MPLDVDPLAAERAALELERAALAAERAALTPPSISETDDKAERKPRGLAYFVGIGLSAGLLAFVAFIAILVVVVPAVVQGKAYTILTSSMEPSLPPGTLIVIKPTPVEDIRVGDILTYQIESGKEAVVTHRVISVTRSTNGDSTFTLKGDNNALADDEQVMPVQIRGVMIYSLPYLGYVNNFVNGDMRQYILPVIVGGLVVYALWMVISFVRDKGKKKSKKSAE